MAYTSHSSLCIWLQDHILDLWLECLHFWTLQSLYPWSSLTTIVHHPSLFYSNSPSCYWLSSTSQKLIHWCSLNLPVPAPPASTNFHYSDIQPWSWADTHSNSCPDFQLSPFRVPVLLFLSSSKGVSWPHPPHLHSIVSLRDQPALSAVWPILLCGLWVRSHILQRVRAVFSTLNDFPKLWFHLLCFSTLKRSSRLELRGTTGASELSQLISVSTAHISISTHTDILASFSLSMEDELSPERITLDLVLYLIPFVTLGVCIPYSYSIHPGSIILTTNSFHLAFQTPSVITLI